MKSNINQILKEQFLRDFNNARKQYEAEAKQKPVQDIAGIKIYVN